MPIISQAKALEDLSPHFGPFYELATGAWEDCRNLPFKDLAIFTFRTKSSAVHDYMVARAAIYAELVEGVRPFTKNLMKGIVVKGMHAVYAIRFKKLDEEGKSKSLPTQQVKAYRNQVQLEGIDAQCHLELGYITNPLRTQVLDVRLVCPSGEVSNAWATSINETTVKPVVEDIFETWYDSEVEPAAVGPKRDEKKDGVVIQFPGAGDEKP